MENSNKKLAKQIKYRVIIALMCMLSTNHIYTQDLFPSEEYYNNEIKGRMLLQNSDDEWAEDGGPGGSGEGDNSGVAVGAPVGDGVAFILIISIIYALLLNRKRINQYKKLLL